MYFDEDYKLTFAQFLKIFKNISPNLLMMGSNDEYSYTDSQISRLYFRAIADVCECENIYQLDIITPQIFAEMVIKEQVFGFGKFTFINLC